MSRVIKYFGKKEILILILIISIAAIIRLIALFNFGTYGFDDMFSVHFSKMNLGEMFSFLKNEVHPPFYYFLLHFWINLFGGSELVNRLLSLILNLCAIPLLYILGKELINKWSGLFAASIFALSYFQIFNAVQVRMYSLLTLLGLISLTLFWFIVVKEKKRLWPIYIISNCLMLLTHLGGFFGLLTQWFWLAILIWKKQIQKSTVKKFILSQVPIILIWLFWLIPFFLPKLTTIVNEGWYFNSGTSTNIIIPLFDYVFLFLKNYWLRFIVGTIIFSAPFLTLLWGDKKIREKIKNKINPLWFLFSWLLPAIIIAIISGINLIRIYIVAYLAIYLIVAYFFYITFLKAKKTFWILVIIWFLISFFNVSQNITNKFYRFDLANDWLINNEEENDKIIIFGFPVEIAFQNYYTGKAPYEGLYLLDDDKTIEERIVEKNWQITINKKSIKKLKEKTEGFNRIIIFHEASFVENYFDLIVHQWFENNNWIQTNFYEPEALLGPQIIIYTKNN